MLEIEFIIHSYLKLIYFKVNIFFLTGIIFERADGEWSGTIPGDVTTTGKLSSTDLTTKSVTSINSHVHGNGNNGADTTVPK